MTRPKLPVRGSGRRLASLLAVLSLVAALAPAHVAAADPDTGYDVAWIVTGPDGLPRTDTGIAVGDDLELTYVAIDGTPISACSISLSSAGGRLMHAVGRVVDGACALTIRLPGFPDPERRADYPPNSSGLDLCVWAGITFADDQRRELAVSDQMQPGGQVCGENPTPGDEVRTGMREVLDIPIVPGGTPREFVSNPKVLSWNPVDWGTDMAALTFGSPWHFQLPAWVTSCNPVLYGDWWTVLQPAAETGCQPWDVRLPGVLPSNLPWSGPGIDGSWHFALHSAYRTGVELEPAWTVTEMHTPMAPSDALFESSLPAIFPVDLATTRFVTEGQPWQPVFQFSGATTPSCMLRVFSMQPLLGDPITGLRHPVEDQYEAETDTEGRCRFSVPTFPEEMRQYSVGTALWSTMSYGGAVFNIPAPEPPTIEPPTEDGNGETNIGVAPGDGQGLGLELLVTADAGATPDGVVCQDSALSTDLENGGAIPDLDAHCALEPGSYLATATMVDAAGVVTMSTRAFTVANDANPPPVIIARMPARLATGVARNVQPTATFDMPVIGVSATSVRLRDLDTGIYVPATVSYSAALHRATIQPTALLQAGHSYRLYVTGGIQSGAGSPLVATSWGFKVSPDAKAPTFSPTPGRSATGTARGANVYLAFSENVRGVTGTTLRLKDPTTGQYVTATVSYDSAKHLATLNPSSTLRSLHRYVVVISLGITDRAGNPLLGSGWSFTTRR